MDAVTGKVNDEPYSIQRREGVTSAERYLKRLCDRTFLSLWSYSGVYRDQGHPGKPRDGKEVADLLVVFEDHVIIFSDKDCAFPNTGNLQLDWGRWFRRAVEKSADQVWGAERWLKSHPDRLFLDRECTQRFPLNLPDSSIAKFHRIVVAHDASQRCQEELGGSGSLMIMPGMIGTMHRAQEGEGGQPFTIGQLDPARGFVHVLDDTSLDIVLQTLDTITDFVTYLTKKEELILSGRLIAAAGEEEMLAYYLKRINDAEEHDFVIPPHVTGIVIDEGLWQDFVHSPQRSAQIEANKISYAWDALIEAFSRHSLAGTQYYTTRPSFETTDRIMRFLARESRTRRRMLARALVDLVHNTPKHLRGTRLVAPSQSGDPYYVFLVLPHPPERPYDEYRRVRRSFLEACCLGRGVSCGRLPA